jgi:hypothetical protein
MQRVVIERARNGWVLKYECANDPESTYVEAYIEGATEEDKANGFADLLWGVKEAIGPMDSRYSQYRVKVVIEPGDKYEDYSSQ